MKGFGAVSYSKSVKGEKPNLSNEQPRLKRSYNDNQMEDLNVQTSCCCFGGGGQKKKMQSFNKNMVGDSGEWLHKLMFKLDEIKENNKSQLPEWLVGF